MVKLKVFFSIAFEGSVGALGRCSGAVGCAYLRGIKIKAGLFFVRLRVHQLPGRIIVVKFLRNCAPFALQLTVVLLRDRHLFFTGGKEKEKQDGQ